MKMFNVLLVVFDNAPPKFGKIGVGICKSTEDVVLGDQVLLDDVRQLLVPFQRSLE